MFIVLYLMSLTAAKLWCLQRESNLLSNTGPAAETTEQVYRVILPHTSVPYKNTSQGTNSKPIPPTNLTIKDSCIYSTFPPPTPASNSQEQPFLN